MSKRVNRKSKAAGPKSFRQSTLSEYPVSRFIDQEAECRSNGNDDGDDGGDGDDSSASLEDFIIQGSADGSAHFGGGQPEEADDCNDHQSDHDGTIPTVASTLPSPASIQLNTVFTPGLYTPNDLIHKQDELNGLEKRGDPQPATKNLTLVLGKPGSFIFLRLKALASQQQALGQHSGGQRFEFLPVKGLGPDVLVGNHAIVSQIQPAVDLGHYTATWIYNVGVKWTVSMHATYFHRWPCLAKRRFHRGCQVSRRPKAPCSCSPGRASQLHLRSIS